MFTSRCLLFLKNLSSSLLFLHIAVCLEVRGLVGLTMNFDDLFADDLKSLEAVMAQMPKPLAKQPNPSVTTPVPTLETSAAAASASFVGEENRVGRRAGRRQQGSEVASQSTAGAKAVTKESLPWELDDDLPQTSATKREEDSLSFLAPTAGRWQASPMSTTGAATRAEGGASLLSGVGNNDTLYIDDDDPLAFLEGPVPSRRKPTTSTSSEARKAPKWGEEEGVVEVNKEEARRRAEQRDLLASLDAVEIELREVQSKINLLQIKSDTELIELETAIIQKEMQLESGEVSLVAERQTLEEQNRKRIESLEENTIRLLRQQSDEITVATSEVYQGQLKSFATSIENTQERIKRMQQQRELLLQNHRFDEEGILVALTDEEDRMSASSYANDSESEAGGGTNIEVKISAALRLFQQWNKERLASIAGSVVDYLHKETNEVAREVRHNHTLSYLQDATARKELLNTFFREMASTYLDFFNNRAQQRSKRTTEVRDGLRQATEKLRELAKQRMESRMNDISTKANEAARRFQKLTLEAIECADRKAAAVRASDDSVARSQYVEQQSRCGMELGCLEKLHSAELDTLRDQLGRLRDSESKTSRKKEEIKNICTSRADFVVASVRKLESSIREQLEGQKLWNKTLRSQAEGVMSLLMDDMLDLRMGIQEKEAVVLSLLDDTQRRQNELSGTRLRCGELREQISEKLQEAVQCARQHHVLQESRVASVELTRTAWEHEQRELLQWGFEELSVQELIGDFAATGIGSDHAGVGQTQLPVASTNVCVLRNIANKGHTLATRLAALRSQRDNVYNAVEKERVRVTTARRGVDGRWVKLFEELLSLMSEQEKTMSQQLDAVLCIAKLEGAKSILRHDFELLQRRRGEVQELMKHLKRELGTVVERRSEFALLQKDLEQKQAILLQGSRLTAQAFDP
ncbi:hypothetical protein, conserved [Trypanosoma brucei brucei TREU927]|uniref:Uncharacterized protein n=2 Tax=Trypanozoon TaxID=39700 RepID=Q385Y3_TRYB2|nr:hypothetical protein, conserved [Trypanosoma brucei brucei TREU927]EAN79398.1 hypothetical protein, conserved [Trypanosoma brucei brucei TREU927]